MTRARLLAGVPILGLALLLTACDPGAGSPTTAPTDSPSGGSTASGTPVPESETRPDRADLALGPDGMGTLAFGVAPHTAPETAMLVLDPEYCTDANTDYGIGIASGDPEAALWVPIPEYRDGRFGDFGVHIGGDVLHRIDLWNDVIPTTEGIRIGATRAQLEAAYPDATSVEEYLTDIYVVTGALGTLQIEVARQPDDMTYWEASQVDRVTYIHAVLTGYVPFSVAASENIAGACPF